MDLGKREARAEGPGVGGGGFAYSYTALPHLERIRRSIEELVRAYQADQLNRVIGATIDWSKFLENLGRLRVDLEAETVSPSSYRFSSVQNDVVSLSPAFLDQLNSSALSLETTAFAVKEITQKLFDISSPSEESSERAERLTRVLLSRWGSCGLVGSVAERKEHCREQEWSINGLVERSPEPGEPLTISRNQWLDDELHVQPLNEILLQTTGESRLWMMTTKLLKTGDYKKAQDICVAESSLRSLGVNWRVPTEAEARALWGRHGKYDSIDAFKSFKGWSSFFLDQPGSLWLRTGSSVNINVQKGILIGAAVLGAVVNPLMALVQTAGSQKAGFYDVFTERGVSVVCVSDRSMELTHQPETEAPTEVELNVLERFSRLNFQAFAAASRVDIPKVEATLEMIVARLNALIDRLTPKVYEGAQREWPELKLKDAVQFRSYLSSLQLSQDALLQPVSRRNANGVIEPLVFDYRLPENLSWSERVAYPLGKVFPVQGFLRKLSTLKSQGTAGEQELVLLLVHELSHLMGLGRQHDEDSKRFTDFIGTWARAYWDDCGLLTNTDKENFELCRVTRHAPGWKVLYRDLRPRRFLTSRSSYPYESMRNEKTRRLFVHVGLAPTSSMAKDHCASVTDPQGLFRLPTEAEVQANFWQQSSLPEAVFSLRHELAKGDGFRILPRCVYVQEGKLSCATLEDQPKLQIIKFKGPDDAFPVLCVPAS
jgi:hypothetical protein